MTHKSHIWFLLPLLLLLLCRYANATAVLAYPTTQAKPVTPAFLTGVLSQRLHR